MKEYLPVGDESDGADEDDASRSGVSGNLDGDAVTELLASDEGKQVAVQEKVGDGVVASEGTARYRSRDAGLGRSVRDAVLVGSEL